MSDWMIAVLLGLIEGLTEFLPISSTGHLLLLRHVLGLEGEAWSTFVVLIQLGAILAIVLLYFGRLWKVARTLHTDPDSRRFVLSVAVAFLPAVVIGLLAHDFIKRVLFESPATICVSLILGGFVLLAIDRWPPKVRYEDAARLPLAAAFGIGLLQCLAMIPGTSRSGATIVGALLLGADKRTAAEFSFFLAMPTMAAAFTLDLAENIDRLNWSQAGVIAVGFVTAFFAGLVVVRALLDFVQKRGYAPFAWWRILLGAVGLAALSLGR